MIRYHIKGDSFVRDWPASRPIRNVRRGQKARFPGPKAHVSSSNLATSRGTIRRPIVLVLCMLKYACSEFRRYSVLSAYSLLVTVPSKVSSRDAPKACYRLQWPQIDYIADSGRSERASHRQATLHSRPKACLIFLKDCRWSFNPVSRYCVIRCLAYIGYRTLSSGSSNAK
jgi:hypothetical protein